MKEVKVIPFPERQPFHRFLREIREAYDEDRITDLMLIYRYKYKEGEERDGFNGGIENYWFGRDSTLYTLGLLEVMRDTILKYMADQCADTMESSE